MTRAQALLNGLITGLGLRVEGDMTEKSDSARSAKLRETVGLLDAQYDGRYNMKTGELAPGFIVNPEDLVLDVGCGDGGDSNFCALRGARVIFADIDPACVAATARRLAATAVREPTPLVSDTNPLPLADKTATRIVASEVIEHVEDPKQFLAELVRVGKPGAQYLIAVPDPVHEQLQKNFDLAPPSYFEKPNHIRILERDEFARLVTDSGLIIERRGAYGFFWAFWWVLFWACKVDLSDPAHPVLDHWARTWIALLKTADGQRIKQALNGFMPGSQYIVARKP